MEISYIKYNEIDKISWDTLITQIGGTFYHHSYSMINYLIHFGNIIDTNIFIIVDEKKVPLAVCSLGISKNITLNCHEISFGGNFCPIPAISSHLTPSERRKLLTQIYALIDDYAKKYNVKLINMITHPLTIDSMAAQYVLSDYLFEPMCYNLFHRTENTLIINLTLEHDKLINNLSKYRRRDINRIKNKGVIVKAYNNTNNSDKAIEKCEEYRLTHLKVAGKETRPIGTWQAMQSSVLDGNATLFIAYINNIPISYLFCGEYDKIAFGWSQANIEEYEREYSPRHYLEWEVIQHYKSRGFVFYEVGERFYSNQLKYTPTHKELTISEFKERYGGTMYPKIHWYGYLDTNMCIEDFNAFIQTIHAPEKCLFNLENKGL